MYNSSHLPPILLIFHPFLKTKRQPSLQSNTRRVVDVT